MLVAQTRVCVYNVQAAVFLHPPLWALSDDAEIWMSFISYKVIGCISGGTQIAGDKVRGVIIMGDITNLIRNMIKNENYDRERDGRQYTMI